MSLSKPTRLKETKVQGMEKKGTKERMHQVPELDTRHEQGAVGSGEERTNNHLKKENVNRKLTTTIQIHSWQRFPPGRNQVSNLTENRAAKKRSDRRRNNHSKVITK